MIGILSSMGVVFAIFVVFSSATLFLCYLLGCKHAWEFVDKTEFPAPLDTAIKNGVSWVWIGNIGHMSKKTVVIVIRCPKCGKAKILRETH